MERPSSCIRLWNDSGSLHGASEMREETTRPCPVVAVLFAASLCCLWGTEHRVVLLHSGSLHCLQALSQSFFSGLRPWLVGSNHCSISMSEMLRARGARISRKPQISFPLYNIGKSAYTVLLFFLPRYWLNVCILSKCTCWNSNAQCVGSRRWAFGGCIGHEGRALMNEINVLITETPQGSLGLLPREDTGRSR